MFCKNTDVHVGSTLSLFLSPLLSLSLSLSLTHTHTHIQGTGASIQVQNLLTIWHAFRLAILTCSMSDHVYPVINFIYTLVCSVWLTSCLMVTFILPSPLKLTFSR